MLISWIILAPAVALAVPLGGINHGGPAPSQLQKIESAVGGYPVIPSNEIVPMADHSGGIPYVDGITVETDGYTDKANGIPAAAASLTRRKRTLDSWTCSPSSHR